MNTKPSLNTRIFVVVIAAIWSLVSQASANSELERWERQARNVTITRDDWGIAHVVGKTDADAVFGMIYAQCEDDFNRVETNYITSLGRSAEHEGEAAIWRDLRQKLFVQPEELKKNFAESPPWLQKLMVAWADGLNFYLAKHPKVKPKVITHFEPWMALSFTEGSIGGDIETINLARLQAFYDTPRSEPGVVATGFPSPEEESADLDTEPRGSNGIAIAPKNTVNKRALLLINPHTSFYFRSELQMSSGEGLNAYGAVTWGQFFVYQGFNSRLGWMHTSSAADAIDDYLEVVTKKDGKFFYKFGSEERPVAASVIKVPYKTPTGVAERMFTIYRTHHGPVVRRTGTGQWSSVSLMHKPVEALMQSYGRTKAKNLAEFKKVMELKANSSNNTLYADADGNIAYFHVNYVPRRDPKYDWEKSVDGSDPGTEYRGILDPAEVPHLVNPSSGWVYNSNNWPWSAAGPSSLKQDDFPKYVDSGVETARGLHAIRVLENKKDFSLETLRDAAYDSYLTWFDRPLPALIKAWDQTPASDPLKAMTAEQIALLRTWDQRWSVSSIPTSLAIFWADELRRTRLRGQPDARPPGVTVEEWLSTQATPQVLGNLSDWIALQARPQELLNGLVAASEKLRANFGKWNTPWGDINRFQRLTGDIVHPFDDTKPSIPVGFTSGNWGSLASFGARPTRSTKKWYGTSGNSFVAVVEFGRTVRAKAVTAGGESGSPSSKHFNDQAERYATGNLRDVYFYRAQLKGHTERVYNPGE